MPVLSPTKPSTPRLSEAARHVVVPVGIVTTGWPQVVAKGAELGIYFDWWQDALGRVVLGKRSDGKYAATVGGVVLSIPRQVGKTYFVGALLVVLCILFPGLKVVWTAHRTRTATNTFRSLQGMVKRKKVWPHVKHIRTANGEQEIGFTNGSLIMFGAREQGFGRGFDELDIEVFDEAQILTEKALEDMVAATNQSRHPHGALLFYMGTPPRPVDPGEAFTLKREKALSGKAKDIFYLECSADADADPDDRAQWTKANLSYPARTPLESMLRLRENLPSDEAWMREALGIWGTSGSVSPIDPQVWSSLADATSTPEDPIAFAVEVSPDSSWTSIGIAGRRVDGTPHVEVIQSGRGTGWVVDRLVELHAKWKPLAIALNPGGPAGALLTGLAERGLEPMLVNARELGQACGEFYVAATETGLVHRGQPVLSVAVAGARKRKAGDAWVWQPINSTTDIAPLWATTLALHAFLARAHVKGRTGKASFF